jgi:acetyltransferase-like isoleucine patch superfamily enzyme
MGFSMKDLLRNLTPYAVRAYFRWLRTWRQYPTTRIAQSALIAGPCKFGEYVTIFPDAEVIASEIGGYSYVGRRAMVHHCKIGRFCSIAPNAILSGYEHPSKDWVSTSPVFYSTKSRNDRGVSFATRDSFEETVETHIGNDVWIGYGAIVLHGIEIADGAIVGAGAVVTKNVAPYEVVGGIPARAIRKRFTDADIAWLLRAQWWNQSEDWLRSNVDLFTDINQLRTCLNIA